jgi:glycosyltransferase involved in cell wall biosynthesis
MSVMGKKRIAILHYSAPPVVGGVESVIQAHLRLLKANGFHVTVIAGTGDVDALVDGTEYVQIPELSSRHPDIVKVSRELEQGYVPGNFSEMVTKIESELGSILLPMERVIVHNVFTKHFNLPLTAALFNLLDQGKLNGCIGWCHDLTWTSAHSRSKVFSGYPWDLLRTQRKDIRYVTISKFRQQELAGLFGCQEKDIEVIYNGVDPQEILGLSQTGLALINRMGLWEADLILLMPVRVTQAKNIELAIRLASILKKRIVHPRIVLTGPPDPHDQDNFSYFQSLLDLRKELEVEDDFCFVYESGLNGTPFIVDMNIVGDLYRVSDALLMPSHREGFGMPILEAGLAGLPVFCSAIPAAFELGGNEVTTFSSDDHPEDIASLILNRMEHNSSWRLRQRVRQGLTWQRIFQKKILPLL